MNYLGFYKKLLLGFFAGAWVIAALTQLAGAQIQRPYEPIVLTGDTLSDLFGCRVESVLRDGRYHAFSTGVDEE